MENKLLLSPEEACAWIGVKRSTMFKMMEASQIPSIKVGRLRRIPVEGLRDWLERQIKQQGNASVT